MLDRDKFSGGILGLVVGDALGVPFEGLARAELARNPATEMVGYRAHNQPAGTWSDDSSLTFCLIENLISGLGLRDLADRFVRWLREGYWTPSGRAFGIGNTCCESITNLERGIEPLEAGLTDEYSNGNGSLMRILPVALYFHDDKLEKLLTATHRISSLTHAHPRSQMACGFYNLFARYLLNDEEPMTAYKAAIDNFAAFYRHRPPFSDEMDHFKRVVDGSIPDLPAAGIQSSAYVVHTLEAVIWCLLHSDNYRDTVLTAVNLGGDADTTAAVAGGPAGLIYGAGSIPEEWLGRLSRLDEIRTLVENFYRAVAGED